MKLQSRNHPPHLQDARDRAGWSTLREAYVQQWTE